MLLLDVDVVVDVEDDVVVLVLVVVLVDDEVVVDVVVTVLALVLVVVDEDDEVVVGCVGGVDLEVVVAFWVATVGTIFSNASNAASSPRFAPTALLEDKRQREDEALKEMDRQVASAVHLALHASTSSSLVCLPIILLVIPEPVPRDS